MIPTSSSASTNGCDNISSNCVVWQGPDIACIDLCTGDTISDVTAKLAQKVCDIITDGVNCNPDLTGLDLTCLNIQGTTPTTLVPVLQAMVNSICGTSKSSSQTPTPSSRMSSQQQVETNLPMMTLPACLQYNDPSGNPVTQLRLDEFATLIANQVCTNLQSIQAINTTLSNYDARISTLEQCVLPCNQVVAEKQVIPTCIINVGQLTDVSVLLLALEVRFCALETAVGTPAAINEAISQTTIQGSTDMLSTNGTYASVTGWKSSPSSLAQSVQNAWSVIDDLYAAVTSIQTNCCPTGCDAITFAYSTANVLDANGLIDSINFDFSASTIPNNFVSEPGKSIITLTDVDGNNTTAQVNVPNLQTSSAGYNFLLPANINKFGDITVSIDFGVTDDITTCDSVQGSVISSVMPCPALLFSGITASGAILEFTNIYGTSAVFTVKVTDASSGVVVFTDTLTNQPAGASSNITGLNANVLYNVELTVAIQGVSKTCPTAELTTSSNAAPCSAGMDVAFVIDYSSSMGSEIDDIKTGFASLVNTIDTSSGSNNYRIGIVTADEKGGTGQVPNYNTCADYTALPSAQRIINTGTGATQFITAWEMFADNNGTTAQAQMAKLNQGVDGTCVNLGSGQGAPEPTDMAIGQIIESSEFLGAFRTSVAKYVICITDDLPGGSDDQFGPVDYAYIGALTTTANNAGIKIFVLGAGVNKTYNNGGTTVYPWRELAINTGGNWNVDEDPSTISAEIVSGCGS